MVCEQAWVAVDRIGKREGGLEPPFPEKIEARLVIGDRSRSVPETLDSAVKRRFNAKREYAPPSCPCEDDKFDMELTNRCM